MMYRQGDVLIVPVKKADTEKMNMVPRDAGRIVLAYGEATGHCHAVLEKDAVLFDDGNGNRILAVESEADLVHDEHDTVKLPKGLYRVIRQVEYPGSGVVRRVTD